MKAKFDFQPHFEAFPKKKRIRLVRDWYFLWGGKAYWIPAGYTIDGASIPRLFWSIIGSPFAPELIAAALAHDWIYLVHILKRAEADEIFYQLLLQCGVSKWRARTMWAAVRSFGFGPWVNSHEDAEELGNILITVAARPDADKFYLQAA
jgi:hypothetical protein